MRLRHFIIDAQKVTTTLTGSTFTAESSPTSGILDTAVKPRLSPVLAYQGAIQTHIDAGSLEDVQFYGLCVSGSLTSAHIYTGDRFKMTGSFTKLPFSSIIGQ